MNNQGKAISEIALGANETSEAAESFSVVTSGLILLMAVAAGLLIAILWNPTIADDTIGVNLASFILGTHAATVTLTNGWFSIAFAIAAGLANTFTACNCVVFSCIAPLSGEKGRAKTGVKRLLLVMASGVVVVTALYGIIGVLLNRQLPSLSKATLSIGRGLPVHLVQSTIVFVILGVILCYFGLVALQLVRNPLERLVERYRWAIPFSLGMLIGGFSIGRPYPLFQTLFQYAAGSGNVLLSALLMILQGLCNIAVMALLFVLLTVGSRGRIQQWMQSNPFRAQAFTAFSIIGGGTFLIVYWGIRLPATFGIGWFPHL